MLYNAAGFALALGPSAEQVARPSWMHFGVSVSDRDAVLALRDRLVSDGVELVEEWDEPAYVSVKCRDPDGYIVEAACEPGQGGHVTLGFGGVATDRGSLTRAAAADDQRAWPHV